MLSKYLALLSLLFIVSCGGNTSKDEAENKVIKDYLVSVYIDKGDTQCNDDGLTLEETSSYLTDANIAITESTCGVILEGENTTVCGADTSNIYIHTIDALDLAKAENIGFKDVFYLSSADLSYEVVTGCVNASTSITEPLYQAHSHNDYEHDRPLLDALAQGFNSVEADLYLIDDQLLVAHDRNDVTTSRTLETLYLDPLFARFNKYDGHIYPESNKPLVLLVDFKDQGSILYPKLASVLKKYQPMLTSVEALKLKKGAVTVIISGNIPYELIVNDANRLSFIDGRVGRSNNSDYSPAKMPLISTNWNNYFSWTGQRDFTAAEAQRLTEIVNEVHQQGKMLRFWAIPNTVAAWKIMYEAGVDLINTDDLEGLATYLRQQN